MGIRQQSEWRQWVYPLVLAVFQMHSSPYSYVSACLHEDAMRLKIKTGKGQNDHIVNLPSGHRNHYLKGELTSIVFSHKELMVFHYKSQFWLNLCLPLLLPLKIPVGSRDHPMFPIQRKQKEITRMWEDHISACFCALASFTGPQTEAEQSIWDEAALHSWKQTFLSMNDGPGDKELQQHLFNTQHPPSPSVIAFGVMSSALCLTFSSLILRVPVHKPHN